MSQRPGARSRRALRDTGCAARDQASKPGLRICKERDPSITNLGGGDDCKDSRGTGLMLSGKYDAEDDYIHLAEHDGEIQSPDRGCRVNKLRDCTGGVYSSIYSQVSRRRAATYLGYWWFLRANPYPGDSHQGEWEGVTVSLLRRAGQDRLQDVAFAAHKGAAWRYLSLALRREGTSQHVHVYMGRDTHAAYPRPCAPSGGPDCHQTNDGNGDNVSALPEGSFDGRRTWGNNPDSECARCQCVQMFPGASPISQSPPTAGGWANWTGHWGKAARIAVGSPPTASPARTMRPRGSRSWTARVAQSPLAACGSAGTDSPASSCVASRRPRAPRQGPPAASRPAQPRHDGAGNAMMAPVRHRLQPLLALGVAGYLLGLAMSAVACSDADPTLACSDSGEMDPVLWFAGLVGISGVLAHRLPTWQRALLIVLGTAVLPANLAAPGFLFR